MESNKLNIAIIGGGLVGSLCACFLAKRGHKINLYEYRSDGREMEVTQGRSINLALSERGRCSLRKVGLEKTLIEDHGIPMKGRMIHRLDGATMPIPYDIINNQCIYSVGRKFLNDILITEAETNPNVNIAFQQKLLSVDLSDGTLVLKKVKTGEIVKTKADLIIGADGAYSSVRKEMLKLPLQNFSQTYIPHGYLELCIPPTEDGCFAMRENYLHIWPRGTFMMIALPNQDRTWTVTLFMPFEQFSKLDNAKTLISFFEENFPDSINLIGKERLIKDYFKTKPSHLISIKCNPYHVGSNSLIIGDAAHAMVPFYGQGMNAGFEDCLLLDSLMEKFNDNLEMVLPEFSRIRNSDVEAMCDLAMYNYTEMRDLVNRKSFLLRKKMDNILYGLFPKWWIPLYNSVTFTTMQYQFCKTNKEFQDKVVHGLLMIFGFLIILLLMKMFYQNMDFLRL